MRYTPIFRVLFLGLLLSACAGALNDFEAGKAAKDRGDYDQAIMLYSRAIDSGELSPLEMAVVYNNRAFAYGEMYSYDQAIADYTRAIDSGELSRAQSRFRPQAAPYDHLAIAHHNRGWVYSQKSLYDQAIADYTRALKLQPDYISAYKLRGNAYDGKGLREQAKADREKARQLEAR